MVIAITVSITCGVMLTHFSLCVRFIRWLFVSQISVNFINVQIFQYSTPSRVAIILSMECLVYLCNYS